MQKALHKRFITKMDASPTFFGFSSLPPDNSADMEVKQTHAKEAAAGQVLHEVLDKGINLIHTDVECRYNETSIGAHIAGRREEYMLSTKCNGNTDHAAPLVELSYEAVKQSIDHSLANLKTTVVDIMFIYFGTDTETVMENNEALRALKEAQAEGKIKFLGAFADGDLAEQVILSNDFDVIKLEYNLLNQTNESNVQLANEKGIGVFIRNGLANGLLTRRANTLVDTDIPYKKQLNMLLELVDGDTELLHSLALNFLYRNKAISSVLISTETLNEFKQNSDLLDQEIDETLLQKAITITK